MFKHSQSSVQGYYLCYYIPSKQDTTPISSLLLKFKNNESEIIIDNFCKWACQELGKEGIQIHHIFTLGKTTFDPNKNEGITMPDFIYKQNQDYPDSFEDMVIEYSLT